LQFLVASALDLHTAKPAAIGKHALTNLANGSGSNADYFFDGITGSHGSTGCHSAAGNKRTIRSHPISKILSIRVILLSCQFFPWT
jgi:hypothetical protein